MSSIMTVYNVDRAAIGHLQDFGPDRVLAHVRRADGRFVSIGFCKDRRTAREAVEAAAAGDTNQARAGP